MIFTQATRGKYDVDKEKPREWKVGRYMLDFILIR